MSYVRRACNIGSVYHASVVRGCAPVSASSSLIFHFWFLKHHHSAATHHYHRSCETQLRDAVERRSCHFHEKCMHAEQIIIIFHIYIYFFGGSMYLFLFSIALYRTIVTVYTDSIFIHNYLPQIHQIIHLSPVGCFTPALGKSVQKNREVSSVNWGVFECDVHIVDLWGGIMQAVQDQV